MTAQLNKRKIFFLALDIQMMRSGIEASVLARASLFEKHLGLIPTILTNTYNWLHDYNRRALQKESRYQANFDVLNLYDYFQNANGFIEGKPLSIKSMGFYKIAPVESTPDYRAYDKSGRFIAYCKNNSDGSVGFINYIQPDGFVWRRETYDSRGFLSKIDLLDRSEGRTTCQDLYLRPNGSVALVRRCDIENNVATTKFTTLVGEEGRLYQRFDTEDDLLQYWLEQIIREFPDAVFIVDRCHVYSKALRNARLAIENDCKVISVLHNRHAGGDPMTAPVNEYFSEVLEDTSASDMLLMFTNQQKIDLDKRFDTQAKSKVIPHGHSEITNIPTLNERERLRVVYLARYAEEKQHNLALEAFKKVIERIPEAQLFLYGFGPKRDEIAKTIQEMGLGSNVFIHEFVQDVESIYRNAGLSILSSSGEGFVLSILESLFCGCPVIAFDVHYGPAAMIQNQVNGFLISPNNVDEFANCIIKVLSDPGLHSQLVQQSSPSIQGFSNEYVSQMWKDELEMLLA